MISWSLNIDFYTTKNAKIQQIKRSWMERSRTTELLKINIVHNNQKKLWVNENLFVVKYKIVKLTDKKCVWPNKSTINKMSQMLQIKERYQPHIYIYIFKFLWYSL